MKLDVCNILLYWAPCWSGLALHACEHCIVYIASHPQLVYELTALCFVVYDKQRPATAMLPVKCVPAERCAFWHMYPHY
jgi:hypothetical protein